MPLRETVSLRNESVRNDATNLSFKRISFHFNFLRLFKGYVCPAVCLYDYALEEAATVSQYGDYLASDITSITYKKFA